MMSTFIPTTSALNFRSWADWAGMAASIGCAIHCAAMPLVIAYLPSLGLAWLADEGFHQYMAVICMILALAAFVPGWRTHRSVVPMAWGAAGLILLNVVAFGIEESCCPTCETATTPVVASLACEDATCTEKSCATSCATDCSTSCTTGCSSTAVDEAPMVQEPVEPARPALAGIPLPLITPLGGLLLVCGHIVNHRKKCRCQNGECCLKVTSLDTDRDA